MKKITSFLVAAMMLLFVLPTSAQISFGLKGGLNLANNKASDLLTTGLVKTVNVENMTGFFVGPTAEFMIPVLGLGLDASLFYSQKGAKYDLDLLNGKAEVKDKLHYVELPVNLKYKFSLAILGIYVVAGPYVSYAVSGDRSISSLTNIELPNNFYNELDYGLNVGAGVELFSHLQVGLQYSWGLNEVVKEKINASNIGGNTIKTIAGNLRNRVFSVSVAYLF